MKLPRGTRIIEAIANLKIYLGNGQRYISDFKYPVFLAIALRVYLPSVSILTLVLIVLVLMVITGFVGWFDIRYIRLAQTMSEISTRKYNPYFTKLEKMVKGKV